MSSFRETGEHYTKTHKQEVVKDEQRKIEPAQEAGHVRGSSKEDGHECGDNSRANASPFGGLPRVAKLFVVSDGSISRERPCCNHGLRDDARNRGPATQGGQLMMRTETKSLRPVGIREAARLTNCSPTHVWFIRHGQRKSARFERKMRELGLTFEPAPLREALKRQGMGGK